MTRRLPLVLLAAALAAGAAAQSGLDSLDAAALAQRVAEAPTDAAARRALAARLTADGEPTAAIPHLRWLAEADPTDADVRRQLAQHLAWADRAAEAVPVLEDVVRLDPDDAEARLDLAEIVTWDGGAARAVELLGPLAQSRPDDARTQRAYAFALLASGDEAAARPQLARALALLPDDPDLLVESGALERWQGDWSVGRRRLGRALTAELTPEQRTRVRDLLDGLERQVAPQLRMSAERIEDSNGVVRLETPARLDVTVSSGWAVGLEVSGDRIGSDAPSSAVGAGRVVPSVAWWPQRGLRVEVAAGGELVGGSRPVAVARALVEKVWAGRRFALARLSVASASATDASSALDGGLRRTRLAAEGYAEPASALALSGTLAAFAYSDDNRRVQAAATAQWLALRFGRRAEGPPGLAVGPTASVLYEDSETLYPASVPYYTPDRLTTLSLGLAARLAAGAGITVEGGSGVAHQTGPGEDATSLELGAAVTVERGPHTVRLEGRRSGSAVYSADVVRLTYRTRAW